MTAEVVKSSMCNGPQAMDELYKLIAEKDRIIELQRRQIQVLKLDLVKLSEEREALLTSCENCILLRVCENCHSWSIPDKHDNGDLSELQQLQPESVSSSSSSCTTRTSEEILRARATASINGTANTTGGDIPRSSTVKQNGVGNSQRVQRQRSFKSNENEGIRRSRQSDDYELSEDLREKQVEMLERKYGGSLRTRRAARTIQRAFRQYCMNKNFKKLRNNFGERRVSKRLSELGRSSTIWGDRLSQTEARFIMGASVGSATDSSICSPHREVFNSIQNRITDLDLSTSPPPLPPQRLIHQHTLDPSMMKVEHSRILHADSSKDKHRLERTMHIDFADVPDNMKSTKPDQGAPEETNNNRNSCPEMNDSSASDSPQPTPAESAIDLHSLDFENLLEDRETDILTDSFHSDSMHSDGSQEAGSSTPIAPHTPITHHKFTLHSMNSDIDLHDQNNSRTEYYSHYPPNQYLAMHNVSGVSDDVNINNFSIDSQHVQHMLHSSGNIVLDPQTQTYYKHVRPNLNHTSNNNHTPPGFVIPESNVVYSIDPRFRGTMSQSHPHLRLPYGPGTGNARIPDASPIWKRKPPMPPGSGGVHINPACLQPQPQQQHAQVPPTVHVHTAHIVPKGEVPIKRMSNISETSEPDSIDGQCYSSSPSSENVSSENVSLGSESSISYQRKVRLSVTPEQQSGTPKFGDKMRKRLYRIGLNLFNKKPEKGIVFLVENSFVEESPKSVARFLITRKGLSKQMIGEYLGTLIHPFNMEVLDLFADDIDLSGLSVDVALRKFQSFFRMPGEAQKIERLMEVFAQRYCMCNPDQVKYYKSEDTIFLLAFAIIMLNTDLHNSNIKPERKMKQDDFIKNLRGIDQGGDVDHDILIGIYERLQGQQLRPGVDHVSQVLKVEQSIVGKKQLSLAHRRLVCYCRLYEVHDPNKREKVGLHQREVFLFNDLLLVTKIFSKKKTGITYSFKQSFPLYGMQVYLFQTPHYQYGIRLTNNIDGKALFTFNARNDHDREKFVDDLKEAILETNGMETLRIEEELSKQRGSRKQNHYINDDAHITSYDHLKPTESVVNRLTGPECEGLRKTNSNSLLALSEEDDMRRGSGGSWDSGVVSVHSTSSANSQDDSTLTPDTHSPSAMGHVATIPAPGSPAQSRSGKSKKPVKRSIQGVTKNGTTV